MAFGLGVDCSDVREVIHLGILEDIESYVQESVPAGRNGLQALAILLKKKRNQHANKSILGTEVLFAPVHNVYVVIFV